MELDKVLARVRALVAKAEAPIADGASQAEREATLTEQATARKMADALMLQYAIEEITAEQSGPEMYRQKPDKIEVHLAPASDVSGYVSILAQIVARHCRCKIRLNSRYDYAEHCWTAKIYGFESDLRYYEILYTTLRLHMIGALLPKPDLTKSIRYNAYVLHNAGLNWIDIALEHGWHQVPREPGDTSKAMYVNKNTGERQPFSRAVTVYETAYKQECAARGEKPLRIPPGGKTTFRTSAAQGYAYRIQQRLKEIEEGRQTGSEIILASRVGDINDLFKEDNPDLFRPPTPEEISTRKVQKVREVKYVAPKFNDAGYRAGVNQANTASLNPAAPARNQKEIS
jgi:hypothetical protein